jgi:hypothetical protein
MALINCPECNSEFSNTAPSCPKCGYVNEDSSAAHHRYKTASSIVTFFTFIFFIFHGLVYFVQAGSIESTGFIGMLKVYGSAIGGLICLSYHKMMATKEWFEFPEYVKKAIISLLLVGNLFTWGKVILYIVTGKFVTFIVSIISSFS